MSLGSTTGGTSSNWTISIFLVEVWRGGGTYRRIDALPLHNPHSYIMHRLTGHVGIDGGGTVDLLGGVGERVLEVKVARGEEGVLDLVLQDDCGGGTVVVGGVDLVTH